MYNGSNFGNEKVMKIRLEQSLRQTQTLNMTQEMRLGIELLQKNMIDLREFLVNEISSNPFLEVEDWGEEYVEQQDVKDDGDNDKSSEYVDSADTKEVDFSVTGKDTDPGSMSDILASFDWSSYKDNSGNSFGDTHVRKKNDYSDSDYSFEDTLSSKDSLPNILDMQINAVEIDSNIKDIMVFMAYNIDNRGFLADSDDAIAEILDVELEQVEIAREELRSLEPEGIGCRDVKDYLKFVFCESDRIDIPIDLKEAITTFVNSEEMLAKFVKKDFASIYDGLKISKEDFIRIIKVFRKAQPYPAFGYDDFISQTVVPDMRVYLINNEIIIEMDNKFIPTVGLSQEMYDREMTREKNKESKEFMKERFRAARWILKSLSERNRTLYEVAASIFNYQRDFFEFGEDFLKPLTLKDIAEKIDKHQSTVSRLTNGKFAITPHGIYELKSFFVKKINENIPATNRHVEIKLNEIIETEERKSPFSDDDIAHMLQREGIEIARRTVAKYRAKLKIPSARERKRDYEFELGG